MALLSGHLLKTHLALYPPPKDGELKQSGRTCWFVVQEQGGVEQLVGLQVTMLRFQ
jgi:hypothetical protein